MSFLLMRRVEVDMVRRDINVNLNINETVLYKMRIYMYSLMKWPSLFVFHICQPRQQPAIMQII